MYCKYMEKILLHLYSSVQHKPGLNSSSKLNFRNDAFQPCELQEVQPTCCIFCDKGELYALYTADQRLFLLVQKVGFTSQEASAFLFPKCPLGLCSDRKASPGLPVPLSHDPRICVCYFLAVTSCWVSFSSFVKAGNTEGVPWRLRAACAVAWPLRHPTWPSAKGTGQPCE